MLIYCCRESITVEGRLPLRVPEELSPAAFCVVGLILSRGFSLRICYFTPVRDEFFEISEDEWVTDTLLYLCRLPRGYFMT